MQTRKLGPFTVSAIGFGCMNLSHGYSAPPSLEQSEQILLAALDAGVTLFDTASLYAFGANETLVGRVLKAHRSKFTLASKGGLAGVQFPDGIKRVIDGRPEAIRLNCEDSLRRLQTDVIDLYYLHRWDKRVPIEDSVGAMADLVQAGKVRTLGLSEVSASTLRKAHAVHPITALQTEYSLWTRNPEIAVLKACEELGVAFVAFSPVARGFLSDVTLDPRTFGAGDIRSNMPRFAADHYPLNVKLLSGLRQLARDAGYTSSQLALAWLLQKAPHIIPIPGTTHLDHLKENIAVADITVGEDVLAALEHLINQKTVSGGRYGAQATLEVDTEMF